MEVTAVEVSLTKKHPVSMSSTKGNKRVHISSKQRRYPASTTCSRCLAKKSVALEDLVAVELAHEVAEDLKNGIWPDSVDMY